MRVQLLISGIVALVAMPHEGLAQRRTVLDQIRVPHHYYFREMYLPQLTSGASGAAWSPGSDELVYSMQGTLWRQKVGTTAARQLTDGPGYDYQPDWSPDGRWVIFSTYTGNAVDLRLLDVASGEVRPLLANGGVNVDARWAPDGRRIAFVSTAYEGRFHVFVAAFENGRLQTPQRITEDQDSGLPRYYYSRFDHYLSPVWSPDGRELLLISNRGRIWGSGGFWRMAASPGAPMRQIHYEETTWRSRADWARDGKRVVYGSYIGRQWHQLWVMTSDGGDPFQLTYGEFDAVSPRWSPDGTRIAYISNEGGNTSLWTVTVPGGRREEVVARTRQPLRQMARLRLTVVDAATGAPTPARVSVTGADGRSWAPDDAWRHADDGFVREERRFETQYFHINGMATLTVPAESIHVEVTRGLEYAVARTSLMATRSGQNDVRVLLRRITNMPRDGWWSGDLHVHMNYGGHYRNTPARLAFQARAEDVHLVENLIVNKEGRIPDVSYFSGRPDPVSTPGAIVVHDQEFHTSYWAHTGVLGLTKHLLLPDYSAYVNTAAASPAPINTDVADMAHEQGAILGWVHPFDVVPDPADTTRALTNEFPVALALGRLDYLETLGFVDDYFATLTVWYRALNAGFRVPAGGGTDAMANFASLRGHVGMDRVYAKVNGPLSQRAFLDAVKAGRTIATNGPIVRLTVDGEDPGGELRLPAGKRAVRAAVSMRSLVPIDRLEIVSNGEVVATVPLRGDRTRADTVLSLPVRGSAWFTARAWTDGPRHPVLDVYALGTTSPVYVLVDGAPIRSSADAKYFIAWIDRLIQAAETHPGWNTAAEREHAVRRFREARRVMESRE